MTDYRLRNHDLLYADRDVRVLTWRNLAIFGAIAITVTMGVAGHLTDRFGPAPAAAPHSVATQQTASQTPAMRLATPASSRSGS